LSPSITQYLPVCSASQQDPSPLEAMHPENTTTYIEILRGKHKYADTYTGKCFSSA
jgi:hypothetical protein